MRKTLPKYYDKEIDKIQCQECGKWFKALFSHIPRLHKISCEEYKEKYLLFNGDLCCQSTRLKMSEDKKRPDVLLKSTKRFLKNVKPRKGKIPKRSNKKRYKIISSLDIAREFAHTKEARKKRSILISKAHASGKFNEAYKKRKNGKEHICIECGKKYYRPKYIETITKFCSRQCSADSEYTKNKAKNFWKSPKAKKEKEKRSKRITMEWNNGKRKKGWKWHKKNKI